MQAAKYLARIGYLFVLADDDGTRGDNQAQECEQNTSDRPAN